LAGTKQSKRGKWETFFPLLCAIFMASVYLLPFSSKKKEHQQHMAQSWYILDSEKRNKCASMENLRAAS